ncbi:ABC transporter permease [Streptomyces sp. NBC_00237]|uniref:ABC transporter permease n=1 Tax=Streptomyces sp. NBC_00237 TaxID=2975687 RepID=UPI00224E0B86|nr:ABC transporter permease [Streptomyces sp. NBC_00237]MCX5200319.1 ABC transporter permease [Streptomyces sp. NBC_00237]
MSAVSLMSRMPRAARLSGPRWVTARQHRFTARVFCGALAVAALGVAVFLVVTALVDPKGAFARDADTGMGMLLQRALFVTGLLPALIGAFVAGPLVARELESGTYTWLWTQSVSPVRWLATKLALATAVTLGGSAVLVVLFRLTVGSLTERATMHLAWDGPAYELLGPVQVAQSALAVGVGTLVGLLMRRTVTAMAFTGVSVLTVQFAFSELLREKLWPVETLVSKQPMYEDMYTPGVRVVEDGMLTASGERVLPRECLAQTGGGKSSEECMIDQGGVQYFMDVHREGHFWPLQLVESGLLLVAAGIAVAVAFRVLRGKHAGAS